MMPSQGEAKSFVKKPNVAYQFYAGDPEQLSSHVDRLLDQAKIKPYKHHVDIIISPHAGYIYSGPVAAYAFKAASLNKYETVIILAPSHYYRFNGISVWAKGSFKTPLGLAKVDEDLAQHILNIDEKITFDQSVYEKEHSVEVEIPFIQKVFKGAKIVPMIFGFIDSSLIAKTAKGLRQIIGNRQDVLIVVSSDMSHYFDDKKARQLDKTAINAIRKYDIEDIIRNNNKTMAIDGVMPILTAMLYAKNKGLRRVDSLKYAHSGHVTGEMDRVVGYVAMAFHNKVPFQKQSVAKDAPLTLKQKRKLLEIAQKTVEEYVVSKTKYTFNEKDPRLLDPTNGVFVTLHKNGRLRGCMGNIIGDRPLSVLVRDMAITSASKDPRFDPVSQDELEAIDVEVSVLSNPRRIKSVDEIEMGKHGVILSQGFQNRGVFLPQVAIETGWSKEKFLSELSSQKAGLASDAWKDKKTVIEIFTADVFSEKDISE